MEPAESTRETAAVPAGPRRPGPAPRPVYGFVRLEADFDHMAPVLYAISRTGRFDITVLIVDPIKSYTGDPRRRFLEQSSGIRFHHVADLPCRTFADRLRYRIFHRLYWLALRAIKNRPSSSYLVRPWNRLLALSRQGLREAHGKVDFDSLKEVLDGDSEPLLVFGHGMDRLNRAVLEAPWRATSVAIPHSIPHVSRYSTGLQYSGERALGEVLNAYDFVVSPNPLVASRYASTGLDAARSHTLGSPRFSSSWTAVLDRILDLDPNIWQSEGRARVLFLISKKARHVDWSRVLEVITYFGRRSDVELTIKLQVNSESNGLPLRLDPDVRVRIASELDNSFKLIQSCDLVLFWGTSVIYDAVRMKKPALYLQYLVDLEFDFSRFINAWNVRSFDDLKNRFEALHGAPALDDTTTEEYDACLAECVDLASQDVLDRYSGFFCRIDDTLRSGGNPARDEAT